MYLSEAIYVWSSIIWWMVWANTYQHVIYSIQDFKFKFFRQYQTAYIFKILWVWLIYQKPSLNKKTTPKLGFGCVLWPLVHTNLFKFNCVGSYKLAQGNDSLPLTGFEPNPPAILRFLVWPINHSLPLTKELGLHTKASTHIHEILIWRYTKACIEFGLSATRGRKYSQEYLISPTTSGTVSFWYETIF
jgi:hypothetical protein